MKEASVNSELHKEFFWANVQRIMIFVSVVLNLLFTMRTDPELRLISGRVAAIKQVIIPVTPQEEADELFCRETNTCMLASCETEENQMEKCLKFFLTHTSRDHYRWVSTCNPECSKGFFSDCSTSFWDKTRVLKECYIENLTDKGG